MQEVHLSNLFPKIEDDALKFNALNAVIDEIKKHDVKFILSHAKIQEEETKNFLIYKNNPNDLILYLAFFNIPYWVQDITDNSLVQFIIDAGFDRSYKKLHNIYMTRKNGIDNARFLEGYETCISTPNYINLLPPAFVDSQDERLIQISDLVIGVQRWKLEGKETDFRNRIIGIVDKLNGNIELREVHWNA